VRGEKVRTLGIGGAGGADASSLRGAARHQSN
jgi:hypothetical protein